jgi:2-haloacid dehalogenase
MSSTSNTKATALSRRAFLQTTATLAAGSVLHPSFLRAQTSPTKIKAVAFDALAIFDPRPVFLLAEELFPGRGAELSNNWRTRQFEYTWLRNSMHRYVDFWDVTREALTYAAKQSKIQLSTAQSAQLMTAYLHLKPWPDVPVVLDTLRKHGIRLALLSNFTPHMMQSCVKASGLESTFELQLSTDSIRAFKPDPAAYAMGVSAFHLPKNEIAFAAFGAWDAAGAKSFGYPTYWTNRISLPMEELDAPPDAVHADLSRLTHFLDLQ